jgi:hypothetical protein
VLIIKKTTIFFETLARTKPKQLFYRVFYVLRASTFFFFFYQNYIFFQKRRAFNKINCDYDLFLKFFKYYQQEISKETFLNYKNLKVIHTNKLCFLNTWSDFDASLWHHKDKSILWNYQLNYMSWLGDLLYEDLVKNQNQNKSYILEVLTKWTIHKSKVSCRSYPTSMRLVTWVQILCYYKISEDHIIDSFLEQYLNLKSSIEFELDGNHILENYIALYLVSSFLKLDNDVKYFGQKLSLEISYQFDINGLHYERSFAYHFAIVERLIVLSEVATGELLLKLRKILFQSYVILKQISNDEGLPLFHDASHDMYRDRAYLESLLKKYSSDLKINLLDESNYLIIEDHGIKFIMDVGTAEPIFQPAHYHCSLGSYIINVDSKPLIIDTGVYGYYENKFKRFHSRRTSSHNILSIKDSEQSNIWSIFRLGKSAFIKSREVKKTDLCYIVKIKYLGFPSLGWVECSRSIIFLLNTFGVIIVDTAIGYQNEMSSHMIIEPSFNVVEKNATFLISDKAHTYHIFSPDSIKVINHEIYKEMGKIEQSSKFIFSNNKKDNLNNSYVSYSVFDKNEDVSYSISENQISISNGLVVDLI